MGLPLARGTRVTRDRFYKCTYLMSFDHLIWTVIRQWKTGGRDTLRVLEAGLLAGHDGERKRVTSGFVHNTDWLIQETENLSLDPRPFQAIAGIVYAWNHPYHTDETPDREHLRAMFDAAIAALPEIEEGIRSRAVKGASRSTIARSRAARSRTPSRPSPSQRTVKCTRAKANHRLAPVATPPPGPTHDAPPMIPVSPPEPVHEGTQPVVPAAMNSSPPPAALDEKDIVEGLRSGGRAHRPRWWRS